MSQLLPQPTRSVLRYLGAALLVILATLFRRVFAAQIGVGFPFSVYLLSVLASASYLGCGPGIAATLLGALAADFFVTPPLYRFGWTGPAEWFGLAAYLTAGVWFSLLIESRRRMLETARQRSSDLRAAHQRLRLHLESSPVTVIEFDSTGHCTGWNGAATRQFGWEAAEVIGKRLNEMRLVHQEDAPRVDSVFSDLAAGRQRAIVSRNRNYRKDGQVMECEWYNSVLPGSDGAFESVLSIGLDITARVRAEEEIRRLLEGERQAREQAEAERRRSIEVLESIGDAFFHVDRRGLITYANERALELTGRARDDVVGRSLPEVFPAATPHLGERLAEVDAKRARIRFEIQITSSRRWFDVHVYPTPDGYSVLASETTARRQMEEQLERAARLESLGVLAGGIAHDFNNLLVAVMGNASLCVETSREGSDIRRWSEEVVAAANRASQLTGQMLAFAGKARVTPALLDLGKEVEEVVRQVRESLPANARLVACAESATAIRGDSEQLRQVVLSLVNNALESLGPSGGCVQVRTLAEEFSAADLRDAASRGDLRPGRHAVIEVRDTGSGMDEATRARIFEPFFTTKFIGRGLGLAAVLGIVSGHKGGILVETAPGDGTRVRVLLPVAA